MKLQLMLINFILIAFVINANAQQQQQQTTKRPAYGYYNNRLFTTRHRILKSHKEPDQLFFGMLKLIKIWFISIFLLYFEGFFPLWSAILVGLTGVCLFISLIGITCYLAGCRNPHRRFTFKKDDSILKQQFDLPMSNDDYVSMSMIESMDKNSSKLFSDSRLISTEYDYEINTKIYDKMKKKRFLKDNL